LKPFLSLLGQHWNNGIVEVCGVDALPPYSILQIFKPFGLAQLWNDRIVKVKGKYALPSSKKIDCDEVSWFSMHVGTCFEAGTCWLKNPPRSFNLQWWRLHMIRQRCQIFTLRLLIWLCTGSSSWGWGCCCRNIRSKNRSSRAIEPG